MLVSRARHAHESVVLSGGLKPGSDRAQQAQRAFQVGPVQPFRQRVDPGRLASLRGGVRRLPIARERHKVSPPVRGICLEGDEPPCPSLVCARPARELDEMRTSARPSYARRAAAALARCLNRSAATVAVWAN